MSNKKPRGQIQAPCTKEGAVTPLFLLFAARIKMEMEISQNTPEKYIQATKSSLISHHLRLIIGSICKISWRMHRMSSPASLQMVITCTTCHPSIYVQPLSIKLAISAESYMKLTSTFASYDLEKQTTVCK